jgi:predicted flap endonuclease-1-like 5' DNA nuclease
MKTSRNLFFGFMVGIIIGLVLYLRYLQQKDAMPEVAQYFKLNLDEGKTGADGKKPSSGKAPARESETLGREDPFEEIRGIGPVYATRLYEAGIFTFGTLAKMTPDQLQDFIGPRVSQSELRSWIDQARKLS